LELADDWMGWSFIDWLVDLKSERHSLCQGYLIKVTRGSYKMQKPLSPPKVFV